MSIYDFIKTTKRITRFDGEIGLEIETETKTQYEPLMFKYWNTHGDGSLRNYGVEYVLKQPLLFEKELPLALDEFEENTRKIKFIKDSHSTSVHVHLNMMNETFKTLGNFLTAYTLVENLLIRYSGPDRLSNLFCLPICDAEETYTNIIHMMKHASNRQFKGMFFGEGGVKYGALNLAAFNTYGSMEIRSFRGETNKKEISDWVSILYAILQYARKNRTPHGIMEDWKKARVKILDEIFADQRKLINHKEEAQLLDKNLFYAASIAYSVKDWEALDKVEEQKTKFSAKAVKSMAMSLFGVPVEQLNSSQLDYVYQNLIRNAHLGSKMSMYYDEPPVTTNTGGATPSQYNAWINQAIGPIAQEQEIDPDL